MTKKEKQKKDRELGRKLRSYGIYATLGSFSDNIFELMTQENAKGRRQRLYYSLGSLSPDSIKVFGNKALRQAVIHVSEKAREYSFRITENMVFEQHYSKSFFKDILSVEGEISFSRVASWCPVGFPVEDNLIKTSTVKISDDEIEVYCQIPETTSDFLVGYDEDDLFICLLPSRVKSVSEAHKVLRPEGIPDDALRQGEFFFVEQNKEQLRDAFENIYDRATYTTLDYNDSASSDHKVSFWMVDKIGNQYASGLVTHSRHKPLSLNGWYRVYLNAELEHGNDSYD